MRLTFLLLIACLSPLLVSTADSAPITDPTPLFTAAEKGDSASIRQALNAGINVNSTDPDGWTPLMVAATGGNLDAVEMLLKAGAAINVASQKGQTPLMAAVLSGNARVVKLLLDQGADASAVTTTGMTALDVAKRTGKKPLIDLLTKAKAPLVKTSVPATSTGTSNGAASKAKVDAAAQAFQSGDFSRATMLFKDVVKASPKDELAWYFLGQSLEKTGNSIDARKAYQTSLDLSPQGEYADQARKKLAALPLPDARQIILSSGLTLLDWMNVTEKSSSSDDPVQIFGEVTPYLKKYGPFPQLQAIRDKALNSVLRSIKLNTPESAREALPKLAKLRSVAEDDLRLIATNAKAQHLGGNFAEAATDYSLWLKLAPAESPQRSKMVNALLQAKKHEALPYRKPVVNPVNAGGPFIKDCDICPDMVEIFGGNFDMGSYSYSYNSERPIHSVSIDDFALGRTEITQGQWRAVMGSNPSYFTSCGDDCPVEQVSWNDAQAFIQKLNAKTGKQYRLPSEAEWEYACRAGGQQEYCGSDSVDSVAWYDDNSGKSTHPVSRKKPNAFGLYDMSGNVLEWVEDSFHDSYNGAPTDGSAWPGDGAKRVLRGGSWYIGPRYADATIRVKGEPADRFNFYGFRVARMLP
ncbi:MAG: SUMF1/EgtB/PvdO family nonheme iron enzyme [Candidatus Nitrotoga sp.]|nr:SUMF1/EgtB/PvdO family nonheme iron enzyme [Candidatus Nitrotoga sp.]